VEAQYPDQARKDGIEGSAVVEALVDSAGLVRTASVLKSSGNLLEDRAAVRAALDWVFAPATERGRSKQTWAAIPFVFRLN
jgi:protein TonB